jgi:hypothetical protein
MALKMFEWTLQNFSDLEVDFAGFSCNKSGYFKNFASKFFFIQNRQNFSYLSKLRGSLKSPAINHPSLNSFNVRATPSRL